MARESAMARRTRKAEERAAEFAKVKAEHAERVMALMANYANLPGFSFKANDNGEETARLSFTFEVDDHAPFSGNWTVPAELTEWSEYYELQEAENAVVRYYEHETEERRKSAVRANALSKLTMEEKALLGLEKAPNNLITTYRF